MNSPWGNRGEICKAYGWTYDYLLWGINWINIQMMLADAARIESVKKEGGGDDGTTQVRELKNKEDIKNYLKGLM